VFKSVYRKGRWLAMASLLAGGTVFQVTCAETIAVSTIDLTSSIMNEIIAGLIREAFGVGPFFVPP
jgi:hypothetical protein